jgi:hypothetical protein
MCEPELTYYPKFNEYRFGWMCGELALVNPLVVLPRVLYPQRPIAQMPRVLDEKSIVAAIRTKSNS